MECRGQSKQREKEDMQLLANIRKSFEKEGKLRQKGEKTEKLKSIKIYF